MYFNFKGGSVAAAEVSGAAGRKCRAYGSGGIVGARHADRSAHAGE